MTTGERIRAYAMALRQAARVVERLHDPDDRTRLVTELFRRYGGEVAASALEALMSLERRRAWDRRRKARERTRAGDSSADDSGGHAVRRTDPVDMSGGHIRRTHPVDMSSGHIRRTRPVDMSGGHIRRTRPVDMSGGPPPLPETPPHPLSGQELGETSGREAIEKATESRRERSEMAGETLGEPSRRDVTEKATGSREAGRETAGEPTENASGLREERRETARETLGKTPGKSARADAASAIRKLPGFAEFWSLYPRKVGKGAALRAWITHDLEAKTSEILAGLTAQLPYLQREKQREGGKYVPHPSTWLNQLRWEDEPADVGAGVDLASRLWLEAQREKARLWGDSAAHDAPSSG